IDGSSAPRAGEPGPYRGASTTVTSHGGLLGRAGLLPQQRRAPFAQMLRGPALRSDLGAGPLEVVAKAAPFAFEREKKPLGTGRSDGRVLCKTDLTISVQGLGALGPATDPRSRSRCA